jgi:hypothetical protein
MVLASRFAVQRNRAAGPIPPVMQPADFDLLQRNPACFATLQAYWHAQQECKGRSADFDGWIGRLTEIPEIPPETLSGIHGKLIAFGYLKFELTPKDASLRYQLTPLGRSAITGESQFDGGAEPELAA